MNSSDIIYTPSDFVAVLNQTLEYAYPLVVIEGELSNFHVNRNRWVYFDLKDDAASVKFFGTVYNLPGPLEDGMVVRAVGQPRLSPLYGFSVNFQSILPVGEGSINKAAQLLLAKLEAEGLFDTTRKRPLPYPPQHIGLIASKESAAFADFTKILDVRWGGVRITHIDVQVQGEPAVADVVRAVEWLNKLGDPPDVLVLTRGGGSADDLAVFSTEQVTRAVAASRIPTLVAIGHEVDLSLAELAADARASTPSNAAELLVPDKKEQLRSLADASKQLRYHAQAVFKTAAQELADKTELLTQLTQRAINDKELLLGAKRQLLQVLDPEASLKRGFAIVTAGEQLVKDARSLKPGDSISIRFARSAARASIDEVE